MNRKKMMMATVAVALLTAGAAVAQEKKDPQQREPAPAPEVARHPAWEQLKALAGDWEGTYVGEGLTGSMKYRVVSNGTAVMLTVHPDSPQEMITVFHPDNDQLIATHYCSAGNQPRMKAVASSEPGVIRFAFLDATNVPKPEAGHMRALVLRIHSADHHTQEWTFQQGEQSGTGTFDVKRVK